VYRPDAGTIRLDGEPIEIASPEDARRYGIAVVHQHSALVPRLTVVENVALLAGTRGRIDRELGRRLERTANDLGFTVDPFALVDELSVADRQRAEIARALMGDASFVILDEPTSVLAPLERDQLFGLLGRLAKSGVGVILVTHRLDEALFHCQEIAVLRHGRVIAAQLEPSGVTRADLIRLTVGELALREHRFEHSEGDILLRVRDLSGAPPGGRPLEGVGFDVAAGEVLGVAGVEGNGQRELSAALTGAWSPREGSIELGSRPLGSYPTGQRVRLVGDIPDDETLALSPQLSTWENLVLWLMSWSAAPTPANRARFRKIAADLVREFEIKTASLETPVGRLSGGNRRRVQLARELSKHPTLLVATYATKGLDVRSTEQVKHWVARLAAAGSAVVYIGSDLDELLDVSDRIAVLVRGRIVGVLRRGEATVDRLGELMLSSGDSAEAA
jgi:ABC-type uncharacterized transport system ATPase subunit